MAGSWWQNELMRPPRAPERIALDEQTAPAGRHSENRVDVLPRRETSRILVLQERGRSGVAVIAQAVRLAKRFPTELTVVALAPQDTNPSCCSVYAQAYNDGVRAEAAHDLAQARRVLDSHRVEARCELLVDGRGPSFEVYAASGDFDLVLLPARGPTGRHHPSARRVRRASDAEVRVVDAPHRRRDRAAARRPVQPGPTTCVRVRASSSVGGRRETIGGSGPLLRGSGQRVLAALIRSWPHR